MSSFDSLSLPEFSDPGLRADPAKPNLLKPGVQVKQISPFLGAEVRGVQLSGLNSAGLDELALLVAEKKVVAFRGQDFKDLSPERQIEIARYVTVSALYARQTRYSPWLSAVTSDQSSSTRLRETSSVSQNSTSVSCIRSTSRICCDDESA